MFIWTLSDVVALAFFALLIVLFGVKALRDWIIDRRKRGER